jgi:glycosyltransferase involved in cell wall biosynthesis/SAM-dependent methyltransferase
LVDISTIMPTPRVSILIPNYNNGRSSSVNRNRDFIGDLLTSIHATLEHDPTPLEIIIADDGSTDDSLDTIRAWSKRTWKNNQPFLRLIEMSHAGVVSRMMNRLFSEARGDIICRFDGDTIVHTPNWVKIICETFDNGPPDLGVIGPKQLTLDGRIHAMGDWLLHPRGYHHIAQGAERYSIARSIECDHVMGCFYCHKRQAWQDVGDFDEKILRGQTIDFGMRIRLAGWRTICTPAIEFTHCHSERGWRSNHADTEKGLHEALDAFRNKWGFDRLAADLDEVAKRYAGTPLLWNARVFGPAGHWPPNVPLTMSEEQSEWGAHAKNASYRQALEQRLGIIDQIEKQTGKRKRVLHVQCRAGLFCHKLAERGTDVLGIDADPVLINLARNACARRSAAAPDRTPEFHVQDDARRWPVRTASVDTVLLFDMIEWHPNPVGLFAEAARVLTPDGLLVVISAMRPTPIDAEFDRMHSYRPHELNQQLRNSRLFQLVREAQADNSGALLAVARPSRPGESHGHFRSATKAEPAVAHG